MFIKKKIFYTLTYTTLLLVSIPVYGQSNNTPIMQSQVNQPNGVAGLDNTGNVVAPIKTDKTISTTTNLDIGTLDSKPRATFFQNYGDAASSPHTIHFGGLENHSDAYLNIIGLAMGTGDASGSILSVQDADSFFYGNRNGAGLTDAIVEFTKTNNNPPRLKAGPEILNAENNTTGRTVTFTKTGFSVSPGFTEKEMQTIYGSGRIRVYSNWKNGNIISDDTKKGLHGLDRPNLYFGYIDPAKAVTTSKIINDPDSKTTKTITTTTFDVLLDTTENNLGWRTEFNENKISPDGKEKGSFAWQDNIALNTPGQNPGDTIDNINDTKSTIPSYVWSYSTPSVFIGMADKKFLHNDMAQFIPGEKEAYRKDSISRSMTGVEYDLFAMQEHDYQYKIDGIMVGADGNGHKLTTDSTDMFLGGDINHHLIIGDTCDNYAIETGGFIVPGACPTTKPNSGHILGQFNGKSNFNEKVSISIANLVKDHPEYSWGNTTR